MVIDRRRSRVDLMGSVLIAAALATTTLLATRAQAATSILFLDDCAGGCIYTPGPEDSRTNQSSIITQTAGLAAYPFGSSSFQQVVECVRTTFAPFDIDVTDVDPGTAVHLEMAIGGAAEDLGLPSSISTVGPFTCNVDVETANRTGFTFPTVFGDNPDVICGVSALTVGSMLGLDHEILEGEVMNFGASGGYPRSFIDQAAPCGDFSKRNCMCGGTTQNSFQQLLVLLPEPGSATEVAALAVLVALGRRRSRKTARQRANRRARRPSS